MITYIYIHMSIKYIDYIFWYYIDYLAHCSLSPHYYTWWFTIVFLLALGRFPVKTKTTFSYMNTILFCNINLRSHPHTPGRYQKDVSPTVYVSEFLSNCGGWKGKFLGPSSRGPCGSRHGESLILCSPHWRKRRCVIPYGHRPHMGHV